MPRVWIRLRVRARLGSGGRRRHMVPTFGQTPPLYLPLALVRIVDGNEPLAGSDWPGRCRRRRRPLRAFVRSAPDAPAPLASPFPLLLPLALVGSFAPTLKFVFSFAFAAAPNGPEPPSVSRSVDLSVDSSIAIRFLELNGRILGLAFPCTPTASSLPLFDVTGKGRPRSLSIGRLLLGEPTTGAQIPLVSDTVIA